MKLFKKKKIFCFDIDGIICKTKKNNYTKSVPIKKNINFINKTGGAILLITGVFILTNQLQAVGFYIIEIFPFMQKFG